VSPLLRHSQRRVNRENTALFFFSGKVIGAVGVSGVMSAQDEQVAMAALAVLNG